MKDITSSLSRDTLTSNGPNIKKVENQSMA